MDLDPDIVSTLVRYVKPGFYPSSMSFPGGALSSELSRAALRSAFPVHRDEEMIEQMEMVPLYRRHARPSQRQYIKARHASIARSAENRLSTGQQLSDKQMSFMHRRAVLDSLRNRFELLPDNELTSGARASGNDAIVLRTHEEL